MNHLFVPHHIAAELKKHGFDEPCFGYYENQDQNLVLAYSNKPLTTEAELKRPSMFKVDNRNSKLPQWATAAPIYQQATDWFREKHNLEIYSKNYYAHSKTHRPEFECRVNGNQLLTETSSSGTVILYQTYQDAMDRCLLEALKLI